MYYKSHAYMTYDSRMLRISRNGYEQITYTVIYGCGGSAYEPRQCANDWNIVMNYDPTYLEFVEGGGCHVDNPPLEENGVMYFACDSAETSGLTFMTLKIKETIPSEITHLTVFISAANWDFEDNPFTFERTLRQNPPGGYFVPEFPTPILPAIAIIGFFGAVLLIKRTKE